jgi:formate hydrogenlyase subunit 6/NADH:ubiquinone oxidoreductase subunit I
MRKCPTHAIVVKRADKTWAINRFRCIMCAACTETCPKKCLSMDGHYTPPAQTKSVDIFRGRKPLQNLQLPQQRRQPRQQNRQQPPLRLSRAPALR